LKNAEEAACGLESQEKTVDKGGTFHGTSSVSLRGLLLVEVSLDFTDLRQVSLVVFRMRFVAAKLQVFLALPMFASVVEDQ
jgi:hypothetical protein